MNKHWEKASKRQIEWADANGLWVAPVPEADTLCAGCAFFVRRRCQNQFVQYCNPRIIFKRKETKMSKEKVKIIQIMPDPQGGGILGLGSDGVVYGSNFSTWQIYLPAKFKDEESEAENDR